MPANSRDKTNAMYWSLRVMQAAQILQATAPNRLHHIVEHLPMTLAKGMKKSGPKPRPATAAEIWGVRSMTDSEDASAGDSYVPTE